MRIAAKNVVIRACVVVDLYVVLTVVEQRCRGIAGIVAKTRSRWSWVQWRTKQILRYGIDRFHSCDVVVENGSVQVLWVVELLARRIAQSGSETTGVSSIADAYI